MISEAWIDAALITAVSGLVAFLIALGVVKVWRMFSGGPPPPGRGRRAR
jgi:hypothetical protein